MLLSQVMDLFLQLAPIRWLDGDGLAQRLVRPGTMRQERALQQAAKIRIKQFLTNALEVFNDKLWISSSNSDNLTKHPKGALERFVLLPVKTEKVGGVLWAWKRVWDGTIFSQEGIWLNSRLLACNFSQVMIFGLIVFFARVFFYKQDQLFNSSEKDLEEQAFLDIQRQILSNFTKSGNSSSFFNCTRAYLELDNAKDSFGEFDDLTQPIAFILYLIRTFGSYEAAKETLKVCYEAYPSVAEYLDAFFEILSYRKKNFKNLLVEYAFTPSQYTVAVWCGLIGGFTAVAYIAIILIPSFISTVMKYRSGVKPTLTNPEFLPYRYAMDTTTVLLGSAFWGCFFTATGAFIFTILLVSCFHVFYAK